MKAKHYPPIWRYVMESEEEQLFFERVLKAANAGGDLEPEDREKVAELQRRIESTRDHGFRV